MLFEALYYCSYIFQMLIVSFAKNEDVMNIDMDTDSKLVPKQVGCDLLKGSSGIAVTLLHHDGSMGAI